LVAVAQLPLPPTHVTVAANSLIGKSAMPKASPGGNNLPK
jgi:hypothetical protein